MTQSALKTGAVKAPVSKDMEKDSIHCWECKPAQTLWKIWRFLKILKVDLPQEVALALPGI